MTSESEKAKTKQSPQIDISAPCTLWPCAIHDTIINAISLALSDAGYSGSGEVSVVLADNKAVQELNKNYRGKDKPTNVLSFPQDDESLLGDVILAYETVVQESTEQGKSFEDHVIHLVVHGAMHLLGHDHEDDDEAEDMESIEIAILAKLGIKNPYES